MVPKKRDNRGRYQQSEETETQEPQFVQQIQQPRTENITITMPSSFFLKLSIIVLSIILLSPWLFIILKKSNFTNLSEKILEFFNDNLSCKAYNEIQIQNNSTGVRMSSGL
jgi:hypothetical protein